jgi:hypothetical protein
MQNVTDDELIVVDLILKRMPYEAAVNYTGFINNLLIPDHYQELGEEKYNKAVQVLQTIRDRHIVAFMREQKYIKIVNQSIPSYTLTDRGKEARDKRGHAEFIRWQEEQAAVLAARIEQEKKEQRKINWPQKYWWAIALITLFIGWVSDLGKEYIKARFIPKKESQRTLTMERVLNRDTSVITQKDIHLLKK